MFGNKSNVESLVTASDTLVFGYLNAVIQGQPVGVFYGPYYERNADGSIAIDSTTGFGRRARDEDGTLLRRILGDPNPDVVVQFLNTFDGRLQIVLYCLDPSHQPSLTTVARAFPNVSLGVPWWFNDSPLGIETHLRYIASVDLLANSAGMVTDSRKLISFGSRTEVFRRVLCHVVGEMVERGQTPMREATGLVTAVAYNRPRALFFEG